MAQSYKHIGYGATGSGSVDAEVARAQAAELAISQSVTAEATRATAAETGVASNLAAEVTRAKAAEQQLATSIANIPNTGGGVDVTALNNEITRAQAAEGVLTTDLAAEVTRAALAENTLTNDLANEVTRATATENALRADVDVASANATQALVDAASAYDRAHQEVLALASALTLATDGRTVIAKDITIQAGMPYTTTLLILSAVFGVPITDPALITIDVRVLDADPLSPTFGNKINAHGVITVEYTSNSIDVYNDSGVDMTFDILLRR